MLSEMVRFLFNRLGRTVLLLSVLIVGRGCADSNCTSRRCLAEMLINYNLTSQPQYENCTQTIFVPLIEYQTVSVDTKDLHLSTRLQAVLVWTDPGLSWNTSVYNYDKVVLPAEKVWTPELQVTNAIETSLEDASSDLLLYNNGTMVHTVILNALVNCEINLFNYPFAADECPVAIQTWSFDGCGTQLTLGELLVIDSSHGDWQTESAELQQNNENRNYIMVSLKIKYSNPFITLMLPSILIILADMVSFALPLGGGERNSFKVTLVLSFTMFLVILNDQLPGDSECSPVIRIHFCVCLILLVLSMLVSLVLTRMAADGRLIFNFWSKQSITRNREKNKGKNEDEVIGGISVVQLKGSDEDSRMLKKVVSFLETLSTKQLESERCERFADTLDTIFFWFYFILGMVYFCVMIYIMVRHTCYVNHFDFWKN
ncbi:5-hydroxytryptamine receptor 3A-like [Channa argus]|uniref:5-hydroxytryptamine receptor 3A-like n=1 Tax=Channa argus TaxID=215402 RepID=UPI003521F49F